MKSIELFVGAGGLGMGLHEAGFKPVEVVEWDRYACQTIRTNTARQVPQVAGWRVIEGDVRGIDFKRFEGGIELVSGGPPCQPFSLGGKHQAYADSRDMFPEAVRALREVKPKAFIFENVKGLTRASFRNYFEYIRLQMEHPELVAEEGEDWAEHLSRLERHHTAGTRDGLHYRVVARVLNAADYGVPQRRERVIFVGFRDDMGVEWSFPEPTHSFEALAWSQIRTGEYWERHRVASTDRELSSRYRSIGMRLLEPPAQQPWKTVRDAIGDLPDPEASPAKAALWENHSFQPGARSYHGHTGSPIDEPAKTLKAGVHGVPGGENMMRKPNGSIRYFTVRESARLQTFPDDFRFHGSWGEAMRQLGNAVPVLLGTVVGNDVAKVLAAHTMG